MTEEKLSRIQKIIRAREKELEKNAKKWQKQIEKERFGNTKKSELEKKIEARQKDNYKLAKEIYNTIDPASIKGNLVEYQKRVKQAVDTFKQLQVNTIKDDKINFEEDNKLIVGGVYMFSYYPKYFNQLVEFDPNPVIIYLGEGSKRGNIYGLNFRYLKPTTRKRLLLDFVSNRKSLTSNDELLIETSVFEAAKKQRSLKDMFHEYILSGPYLIGEIKRLSVKGYENIIDLPNTILPGGKGYV